MKYNIERNKIRFNKKDLEREFRRKVRPITTYEIGTKFTDGKGLYRVYTRNHLSTVLNINLSDFDKMVEEGRVVGIYIVGSNGMKREYFFHPKYKLSIKEDECS